MSVKFAIGGAATSSGFTVKARITGTSGALVYSTDPAFATSTTTATVAAAITGSGNILTLPVTGLSPGTRYYWMVIDGGVTDTAFAGQTQTHPVVGQPASFRFAASSCAGHPFGATVSDGVSNHLVFDTIREWDPLLMCHMGDLHYRNINVDDENQFREAYLDVFTFNDTLGAAARQGQLYRSTQLAYVWDDHDFGPNNSDRTSPARSAANKVYREVVPGYAIPDVFGIYQAWQIGRVQFVQLDTRCFRDVASDPQSPSKTMLGADQKAWLRSVLTASTAKFLVLISPTPWAGRAADTWAGYVDERNELGNMFIELGWADRMCLLTGDRHANAIDTGPGNPSPAKFPQFMFGSLDSEGAGTNDTQYDLGLLQGLNQWGACEIVDSGNVLTFTGSAMIGTGVWRTHTITLNLGSEPEPVDPIPAAPEARRRTKVTWLACNLATGAIVDELPTVTGGISRVLGAYTNTTLTVPIPTAGPGTRRDIVASTEPGQIALVAVINDVPAWAGAVLTRSGGSAPTMSLGTVTLEGYLARRYINQAVGPFTAADDATIAKAILAHARDVAGVGSGIGMLVDAPATGTFRDWEAILPSDHRDVYDAMTALMAVEGGPEWTIDHAWGNLQQSAVAWIARVRPRIGLASSSPPAVFEPGRPSAYGESRDITYTYKEDLTDGLFANFVRAYSSGENATQPTSDPISDPAALLVRPLYEHHWQPDANITDKATLNAHARAKLSRMSQGARTWELSTRWDTFPRLHLDWGLGDDVGWRVTGPRHPGGVSGQGRAVGWEIDQDANTVKIILWEPV